MNKKFRELASLSEEQRKEKLKELKFELVKNSTGKTSKIKKPELRKAIARILYLNSGGKSKE